MAKLTSYFVKDIKDLTPKTKYMIRGNTYRFSVLTPRLIRIEYNANGQFEDRPTSLVINRQFSDFNFNVGGNDTTLIIKTEYFTLNYTKERPIINNNIKISINGTDKEWYPEHKEIRNIGSIGYSLDYLENTLKLEKGLYSLDGFAVIDDSHNFVIDNEVFCERDANTIDLYIFTYRTDLGLCLQDYFNLTGYPPMIPRYALGSWWYKNDLYNTDNIEDILKKFSDNKIPLSVFLLGNKWHNNTANFTFDRGLFDTTNLKSYLLTKPQKFGLTINPETPINEKDPIYNAVTKYIHPNDNGASFVPFSNLSINLYLNLVVAPLMNDGITFFNIDYNNPDDPKGLFLLNHYHYVVANMNGYGFILSRNPQIAPHRYPILYSGKTKVSWDTLKNLPAYNNSAANMGISWHAHAIGGWYGGSENEELYIRYIQFGVFNPIFILASDAGKFYKREPWKWNSDKLSIIREYICLRNKLIPYIYNEGFIYHKYGVPLVQPLYYKYPKIYDEPNYVNQFFFGSRIMISPIVKEANYEMNRVVQKVFIPNGTWYEYASGKKFAGNKYYTCFYNEGDYPIFIKEGSIIPMSLDDDTNCPKNMELQIFPAENGLFGSYELYEDDGLGISPVKNDYVITKFNLDRVESGYKFTITRKEGNYNLPNRDYTLRFRNMKSPAKVTFDKGDGENNIEYSIEKNDLVVNISDINSYSKVEVNIIGHNIEIEKISVINEEIEGILDDLEISTFLKEQIDAIILNDEPINKKRIALRKLKKDGLEPKFINMFIELLEYAKEH